MKILYVNILKIQVSITIREGCVVHIRKELKVTKRAAKYTKVC
jgi:hypothetical protein